MQKPILTMGNFDGVHRGHQAIFARVVAAARAIQGTAVVYTFDPHPVTVLAPDRPFALLQTVAQRKASIAACGIDVIMVEPFTRAFAQQSAVEFFENVICRTIAPVRLIIGYDFTFGSHRSGRVEHLKTFAAQRNMAIDIIEPVFDGETLISSSYIRQCIRDGRLIEANRALGRSYAIEGTLVGGRGIGRQLGFPTANLLPDNALIPPEGVYITTATMHGTAYPAATYIGRNPTFGGTALVVETYLLDFTGTITTPRMEVAFHQRLRGDIRFDSPEALKVQIAKDVDEAKKYHRKTS